MTRLRSSSATFERPADVDSLAIVTVLRVPPEVAGQRLDVFVQSQLRRTSRTRAQAIVKSSAYDPEGRRVKVNDRVKAEQQILLWRPPWDENPVPTTVNTLYEDEHLLAVDKPANLPVHPTARYYNNTLIKVLQALRPGTWLSLGHRLDRETSGVILVSKSSACDRALKKMLERREGIEKVYLALTWGRPEIPEGAPYRCERSMELDMKNDLRVKMKLSEGPQAMHASTVFEILGVRASATRSYSMVQATLETGRQHQIRLHLASLGAPVVGDKLYGPDERLFARGADRELTPEDEALLELPRHALHAHRLALFHPLTREPLVIEAPLPEDLAAFWEGLAVGPGPA